MNFISYQELVKMVKDVNYSKGLSLELALEMGSRFSPEIFEGMVAFSGVVKLGSITNVTRSAT